MHFKSLSDFTFFPFLLALPVVNWSISCKAQCESEISKKVHIIFLFLFNYVSLQPFRDMNSQYLFISVRGTNFKASRTTYYKDCILIKLIWLIRFSFWNVSDSSTSSNPILKLTNSCSWSTVSTNLVTHSTYLITKLSDQPTQLFLLILQIVQVILFIQLIFFFYTAHPTHAACPSYPSTRYIRI